MTTALTWDGDPTVLIPAVRWAFEHGTGSHMPLLVAVTVRENAHQFPDPARRMLEREITVWLDGRGATAPPEQRAPWQATLSVLAGCAPQPPSPRRAPEARRRADVPAGR